MSLITDIQRDIERGPERANPATCVWNSLTYPCSLSAIDESRSLVSGGFQMDIGNRVVIRSNAKDTAGSNSFSAATQPTAGNLLTVNGTERKIESVKKVHGAYLVLMLADINES